MVQGASYFSNSWQFYSYFSSGESNLCLVGFLGGLEINPIQRSTLEVDGHKVGNCEESGYSCCYLIESSQ